MKTPYILWMRLRLWALRRDIMRVEWYIQERQADLVQLKTVESSLAHDIFIEEHPLHDLG